MGIGDWYDKEGRQISVEEWGRLNDDLDYKRIALTEIGPYTVSTVWLGLDHRMFGEGPPVLFETMVFTTSAWKEDRSLDDPDREMLLEIDGQRYCTEHEARRGHEDICLLIEATWQPVEGPQEAAPTERPKCNGGQH